MTSEAIFEKARKLAATDKEVNGHYSNTPYKFNHNGIWYKAEVRPHHDIGSTTYRLHVYQLKTYVGYWNLKES